MSLAIENISYQRNHKIIFREINCTLAPTQYCEVRGSNGAGKTTLLRILASLNEPTSGKIEWQSRCIFDSDHYSQHLHYVGHQNALRVNLSVTENLHYMAALKPTAEPNYAYALETLQLSPLQNKKINQLSAGQQRRVSLAKLFLHSAPLWILDEPTTALDQNSCQLFSNLLADHLKTGIAIIATHQPIAALNKHIIDLDQAHA